MFCGAGDCAPTPTVNTGGLGGVSTSCAVAETVSVTGITIGLPTAAPPGSGVVALMVMVPLDSGDAVAFQLFCCVAAAFIFEGIAQRWNLLQAGQNESGQGFESGVAREGQGVLGFQIANVD